MRKSLLIVVATLALCTFFIACSNEKNPIDSKTENNQVRNTGITPANKLTVVAPAGWTPNTTNPNVMMKGTGTYTIKPEYMPGNANTPDAFVEFAKSALQKSFKNCKFGPTSSLTISGHEARRFEYSGDVFGMKMSYIMLYVFSDGRAHSLTCGAMTAEFGKLKQDYEKIIASAKLE
ncbi:MAG: hypothetical protein CVV44_08240 [Spirochaetae bacterium HGW-Spirochaetae-1]|jgi:hypothetical protein|nr:MAG: hypothetical protein CVV44_08240 [Spirochaetae bacterium HGW-Spirochaetae-1]